jgi:pSer/pThr/pTyr-binding forkhead associated (FHA) protein
MAVQASLVYTAADGTKQDLILRIGEDTTIGRHPNCSLTISQPSVSRRHARLWFDQGVWFVEDLQSSNGTFVNNRRINRAQLTEGDELRCGDFVLTYGVEEKTRAVKTSERREKPPIPAPTQSPQVSNRATIGLDSPPPIPEAPRLAPAPAPPTPPSPEPLPSPQQNSPFDGGIDSNVKEELAQSQQAQTKLQDEIRDLQSTAHAQENELQESRQATSQANASLQALRQERDAAARDVERLEEQRERQDSEINELSTKNRDLLKEVEALQHDLDHAKQAAEFKSEDQESAGLREEVRSLKDQLNGRDQSLATLKKDLEEMHLRAPTQAGLHTGGESPSVNEEFSQALSSHSSELRVALKSASGFVQEVKDVFTSVSTMNPGNDADKTVLELEDTFDENGGMDPVTSLESAFDKMEQTARKLRRLSKKL